MLPSRNRRLQGRFNEMTKTQVAEMLSMLALIKVTGDVVLPEIAPAYRPIAFALDD